VKPREFWLDHETWLAFCDGGFPSAIHVIEKSAYSALMAEAMKLREALKSPYDNIHFDASEAFDQFLEGLK